MTLSEKVLRISYIVASAVCFVLYAILACIAPTILQIVLNSASSLCWGVITGLNIADYTLRKKLPNYSETENEK